MCKNALFVRGAVYKQSYMLFDLLFKNRMSDFKQQVKAHIRGMPLVIPKTQEQCQRLDHQRFVILKRLWNVDLRQIPAWESRAPLRA